MVESFLSKIKLPDLESHISVPIIGKVEVKVSSIHLSHIHVSGLVTTTSPPTGVVATVSSIELHAAFDWKWTDEADKAIGGSGTGEATATAEATLPLDFHLKQGRPQAKEGSLHVKVVKLSIHMDGPDAWLYDAIADMAKASIEKDIEGQMAKMIKEEVASINHYIEAMPFLMPLPPFVVAALDIHFTGPLLTFPWGLSFPDLAEFKNAQSPTETPFTPQPLPTSGCCDGRQSLTFLSDAFPNSLFYVYWANGDLNATITPGMIPAWFPQMLDTKYWRKAVPGLYDAHPKSKMICVAFAPVAPYVSFAEVGPHGANMTVQLNFTFHLIHKNNETEPAFTYLFETRVWANTVAKPGPKIAIDVTYDKSVVLASQSWFGPIDQHQLLEISASTARFCAEWIGSIFSNGWILPTIPPGPNKPYGALQLVNPKFHYLNGALLVETDFEYVPAKKVRVI